MSFPRQGHQPPTQARKTRPWPGFLVIFALAGLVLGAQSLAHATEPIPVPKSGICPPGYASSASYCVPIAGISQTAIPKVGQCPPDWISSAHYCLSPPRKR